MCEKINDFKLCTCADKPIIHNKNSRRNKKKTAEAEAYKWYLRRYVETIPSGEIGRVMMPSFNIGQGLTDEFVLQKLNNANCFDFDYTPQEGDSLTIEVNDKTEKYLAFGFENGEWTIGRNYDAFNDILVDINKGNLKKLDNDIKS